MALCGNRSRSAYVEAAAMIRAEAIEELYMGVMMLHEIWWKRRSVYPHSGYVHKIAPHESPCSLYRCRIEAIGFNSIRTNTEHQSKRVSQQHRIDSAKTAQFL